MLDRPRPRKLAAGAVRTDVHVDEVLSKLESMRTEYTEEQQAVVASTSILLFECTVRRCPKDFPYKAELSPIEGYRQWSRRA